MVDLKIWFKRVLADGSRARKTLGVIVIILGMIALVTPFSFGAWLIFIGLGFLGVRIAFWEKTKVFLSNKYLAWKNKKLTGLN